MWGCSEQHGLRIDFSVSNGRPPPPEALSSEYCGGYYGDILFSDFLSLGVLGVSANSLTPDIHGHDLTVIMLLCPAVLSFNFSGFY